jgi:hypothetical protein
VPSEQELIAQAEIGEEARKFVESDLGKCVLGMAEQEALAAMEELVSTDPGDWKKIARLQMQIQSARNFEKWLAELIDEGDNAISVFKQQRGD